MWTNQMIVSKGLMTEKFAREMQRDRERERKKIRGERQKEREERGLRNVPPSKRGCCWKFEKSVNGNKRKKDF